MYVCIYIYIEREREKEGPLNKARFSQMLKRQQVPFQTFMLELQNPVLAGTWIILTENLNAFFLASQKILQNNASIKLHVFYDSLFNKIQSLGAIHSELLTKSLNQL
jgi:hypothetical protein